MKNKIIFYLTLLCLIGSSISLQSATVTWIGGNAPFMTASNWDTGFVPGPNDDVIIPSGWARLYNTDEAFVKSVEVQSSGRLSVYSGAALVISNAYQRAGLNNIGRTYIYGKLTISHVSGYSPLGVFGDGIYNTGSFRTYTGATIYIAKIEFNGIDNRAGGYFYNRGSIAIENTGHSSLINDDRFRNLGTIEIEAGNIYPEYGIVNFDDFINASSGEITVNGGGAAAIGNNTTTAAFRNDGIITCNHSNGLGFSNRGNLYNAPSAELRIFSTLLTCLDNSGTIDNYGHLLSQYGGTKAVWNGGSINNHGSFYALYSNSHSYYGPNSGSFDNHGSFYSLSYGSSDLYLSGSFINHDDGYFTVNKGISVTSSADLINDGIFTSNLQTGNHWNGGGTFVNNGAISDRYDSFGNAIDNQQVMVQPLSGTLEAGVPFPNALNVTSLSNVTVGTWRVSINGASAGTYNAITNEFTPNSNAVGRTRLYVTIDINASGNGRIFKIDLDNPILPLSGNDDPQFFNQPINSNTQQGAEIYSQLPNFNAFPNPSSGSINIEHDGWSNSELTLRVYNTLGELVLQKEYVEAANKLRLDFPAKLTDGIYYLHYIAQGQTLGTERVQLLRH